MQLTLTAKQRLSFARFLGSRPGCKNPFDSVEATRTLRLLEKVRMPEEEEEKYFRPLGNGQMLIDNQALRSAPPFVVEIGPATVKLLKDLFKSWETQSVEEFSLLSSVKEQIDPSAEDNEDL